MKTLPALAGWGMRFLRNSTPAAFEQNHRSNLRLAMYSLGVMRGLRERTHIEYGRAARGSLGIFRDRAALDHGCAAASRLSSVGLKSRRLSTAQTIELEPALAPIADRLSGAIHFESDEVGDAQLFCEALTDRARREGVEFRFDTEVASLQMNAGGVSCVTTRQARFTADRYVVAAGSYSSPLLRHAGIRLPVQPAKGYSVTFDRARDQVPLSRPVIDHHLHAAIVPFEDGSVRVAGTAEFAGYDRTLHPARVQNLLALMRELLPQGQWELAAAKPWCGLRPSSPDGVAIVGPSPVDNLWVNSGQGHLGWTMAAGSAQLLADLMSDTTPAIDPSPYALARF
jgi:D-amino-acid dehydrogenase